MLARLYILFELSLIFIYHLYLYYTIIILIYKYLKIYTDQFLFKDVNNDLYVI